LPARSGTAFEEFARRPGDVAIVGVAAVVTLDQDGSCADARLAFAGAGGVPVRAARAEALLSGRRVEAELVEAATRLATDEIELEADALVSAGYRRHLARVLAGRALRRATENATATDGAIA
jgi:carbon-monoxide dehydrogenase medium subunit